MRYVFVGILLGLALLTVARAQLDWGTDREIMTGPLAQHGIAADRTPGPDTVFVGAIRSQNEGDIVNLFRTTDRGESWTLVWQDEQLGRDLSNLTLHVTAGNENWVFLFWLTRDSVNQGDVGGVRLDYDGQTAEYLYPTLPGAPDTLRWLAVTRSYHPVCTLYVFYQDEAGLAGTVRNPLLRYVTSADYGLTWSLPVEITRGDETPAVNYGGPGCLYVATRNILRRDIWLWQTTDGGQNWTDGRITWDSTEINDMFPSVAAAHDSSADSVAWVAYDSERTDWAVRGAYTLSWGRGWFREKSISSGVGNEYWSNLDCAGFGSRRIRVVYVAGQRGSYRVHYRTGTVPNPSTWSNPIVISDRDVTNAMPPVVISYGVAGDTLDQGIVFYAEPGPTNLWFDAYQFVGIREAAPAPASGGLAVRRTGPDFEVGFHLSRPGPVEWRLYASTGRLLRRTSLGFHPAGDQHCVIPTAGLTPGAYELLVLNRSELVAAARARLIVLP